MFNWFKKKQVKVEKIFFVNIEIPEVLSPVGDRSEIEDLIEDFLQKNNLGDIDGGGTFYSKEGIPISSDITIVLHELNLEHYKQVANFIKENVKLPKGSILKAERDNYYSDEELKDFDDIELS